MDEPYEVAADGSVVLTVYVQPGASRDQVVGRHGGALKVKVVAPPEGGRANTAVVRLLASALDVRRADVELVAGETSRSKRVRLNGVGREAVGSWLAAVDRGPGHSR